MSKTLKKLKKLRGRSLDELKVRGAQAFAVCAERARLSASSRVPTDAEFYKLFDAAQTDDNSSRSLSPESLLEHFRTRTSPRFFPSFADREATREELRRRLTTQERAALVARAGRITEGRFRLLGFDDISFGNPIDWHFEPLSMRRTPRTHWSSIDYLNAEVAGDKKIIWELNRQQYFMTLGRAYWLTGDERYAATFAAHLAAWMEANPPKVGINWASSLEVAFRSIAWLWALYFFKDSPHLTPALFLRALKFLYLHARHLETYLSTYFSPNTHLTGEALGLFYMGTLLPEFREAARWRKLGQRTLLEQLPRQVRADGVYFEQSSYYQRYTADFYTHLLILSEANGHSLRPELEGKLAALLDHLMHITRPDGTTPFFGDDDGGRLVMLDERASGDFRAALSNGAAILNRPDYKYVAGSTIAQETLWLTGRAGLEVFERLESRAPAALSRAFEAGGYYSMRDGWTAAASHLLIDCGPHGGKNPVHSHADALSFEFAAHGRTLLVDPGTYTYTGDARARDYFRSSAAHNTLVIDNQSSSLPGGAFAWATVAHARPRRWTTCTRFTYFEGEHDGYARLATARETTTKTETEATRETRARQETAATRAASAKPEATPARETITARESTAATHRRGVLFLSGDYAIVRDRVETVGAHRYELYFHFAPDAEPLPEKDFNESIGAVHERGTPGLSLYVCGDAGGVGEWRREAGWVSRCYGAREAAPVCVYTAGGAGAQEFYTFLIPSREGRFQTARVRAAEASGGRAFTIQGEEARDVLLVKSAGAEASARSLECDSDFEWTWLRFAQDGDALMEWTLVGDGSRFRFRGREIFGASTGVGYVAARRSGEQLSIETDADATFSVALDGAERVSVNGQPFDLGRASSVAFAPVSGGAAYSIAEVRRARREVRREAAATTAAEADDAGEVEEGETREGIYVRN